MHSEQRLSLSAGWLLSGDALYVILDEYALIFAS